MRSFWSPKLLLFIIGVLGSILVWMLWVTPFRLRIPADFMYQADISSIENFYDETRGEYSGPQYSITQFSYKVVSSSARGLLIKNKFDAQTPEGKKIISLERLYGIDPYTGQHVTGLGDKDRTGFLFAPRGLNEGDAFTYWHANYDSPAVMQYVGKEKIYGTLVYHYETRYDGKVIDQTNDLTHLPGVPDERRVILEPHLEIWIEPTTGWLVKYRDDTIAYYHDRATGKRLYPWNHFSNQYTEASVIHQAALARQHQLTTWRITYGFPGLGIFSLFLVLFILFFKKRRGSSFRPERVRMWLTLALVLLIFLALTIGLWRGVQLALTDQIEVKFQNQTDQIASFIQARMNFYTHALIGAQGLFAASKSVEADEWDAYIKQLDLARNYNGISGMSYAQRVTQADRAAFPYPIYPTSTMQDEFFPLVFNFFNPTVLSSSTSLLGFDLNSEEKRRQTLVKATDRDELTASPVVLGIATHRPTFSVYAPIYQNGRPHTTSQERRTALVGFVSAGFRVEHLFEDLATNPVFDKNIDIEIYDTPSADEVSSSTLLYDNNGTRQEFLSSDPRLSRIKTVTVGGRIWSLYFTALPSYQLPLFEQLAPYIVLLGGSTLSFLLVGLIYSYARSRERALGYAEELTKDLRQSRDNLASEKARDEAILQSIGDGLAVTDAEGRIVLVNKTFETMLGWNERDIQGKKLIEVVPLLDEHHRLIPEKDRLITKALQQKDGSTITAPTEVYYQRKDQTVFPISLTVSPILFEQTITGAVEVFRNVTVEKENRDRLAAAKAQDEAILASIGDGLVVVDAQGNYLYFNEPARHMLGIAMVKVHNLSESDSSGVYYSDDLKQPVPPQDLPLARALRGEFVDKVQLFIQHPLLNPGIYITTTARPMIDEEGKILGGVLIFHDITRDKEIDKAKTEFVSLASHQLRTPLSAINWYTEMLLTGDAGSVNSEQKQYLDEVAHASQRMIELVNSLLNVSRIDLGTFAVEPAVTNVIEIAQSVVKELVPQITEKQLLIKEQYDPTTPTLKADPKLLRIIFQNILSNAVKYTPEKGKITVAVTVQLQTKSYGSYGKGVEKEGIMITISDTGYGIPAQQQDKIFSKLFRADNVRAKDTEGTGLGLYIVKAIVDQAGGTIRFDSVENKGTTFYITLPLIGMKKKEGSKGLS